MTPYIPSPSAHRPSALDRLFVAGTFVLLALIGAAGFSAGCGGTTPSTRYYDLAAPPGRGGGAGGPVIAVEPLTTDDAYDDERMVYRASRYRLDYYDYHRWSAAPGVMIGSYLERGLERSGLFGGVVREGSDAGGLLTGRVVAIEEIDVSKTDWRGRLVIELQLVDPRSGDTLWRQQFEETEKLERQSPEGLAGAMSRAMERVVTRAAPAIHASLSEHLAAGTKR